MRWPFVTLWKFPLVLQNSGHVTAHVQREVAPGTTFFCYWAMPYTFTAFFFYGGCFIKYYALEDAAS